MRKILIPIDITACSKKAIEMAISLSKGEQEIHLLHVIGIQNMFTNELQDFFEKKMKEVARSSLKDHLALLENAGVPYSLKIEFGDPAKFIVKQTESEEYSCIVMGTHGYGRIFGFFNNSVSYPVLGKSSIPLILVPEETKIQEKKTILVAVDGSDSSVKAARTAIEMGRNWASHYIIMTVVVPPVTYMGLATPMYTNTWLSNEELTNIDEEIIEKYKDLFISNNIPFTTKVLIGDPAHTIKEVAKEQNVDMIALGHRGMNWIIGEMLGSVTYKVIHKTPASLLIVQ